MMKSQSWSLYGGLDLTRPALMRSRAPGALIGCMNYESREEGYRRIDGYERFDGHKSPSDTAADNPEDEATNIETRRAAISAPPGTGDIRGVWRYKDKTYSFRENSAGVVVMHQSSATGWVAIDLGWKVAFTTGTGDPPGNGDALADTSSTAGTVIGLHITSGTFAAGDAAGFLIFSYDAAARYASGAVLTVAVTSTRQVTLGAVPAAQVVGTGEKYQFVNYNFFGGASGQRMYGVTGQGDAFEYDGTMFFTIVTGVSGSSPIAIAAHSHHLFVGYEEGSVIVSSLGQPRNYVATGGAAELAFGDTLTGMVAGFRGEIFFFGRNSTFRLTGTTSADWALQKVSDEAGAMAGTAQLMDEPICMDDRGLRTISTTEAFGDFDIATISNQIRPLLDFKRDGKILPVASVRVRRKSQYRLFFNDGDTIIVSYVMRRGRIYREYTQSSFDRYDADSLPVLGIIKSICSVEDSDGRERIFFSFKDGEHVYEMDSGDSFDGQPITAYMRLPYNDFGMPDIVKRFRKVLLECNSTFESRFRLAADYDDDQETGERPTSPFRVLGPPAIWGEQEWSNFYWGADPQRKAELRLHGRGRNVSLIFFSQDDEVQPPHLFTGVTLYYDQRKMKR